jgi:DNA-directed RNA polymerase subunit RPC12/RpoP
MSGTSYERQHPRGAHMAKWLLVCPHCSHKFAHMKINDATVQEAYRISYGTDAKPDLGEAKLTCPYCQMESLYRRFHLVCEDDSDQPAKGKGA